MQQDRVTECLPTRFDSTISHPSDIEELLASTCKEQALTLQVLQRYRN